MAGGFFVIEFFEDDQGRIPIQRWLENLDDWKYAAALSALEHVLARLGKDVCKSEWGKNLGGGIYELRIRHTAAEIQHMFGDGAKEGSSKNKILLRVFFHPYGEARILLLHAYDKGASPSPRAQQRELDRAKAHLQQFKRRRR